MDYNTVLAVSFSILVSGVIGLIRVRKINRIYYPFLCLIWIGIVNEIISYLLIKKGQTNAISNNIYYLAEGVFIVYQFKKWKLYNRPKSYYDALFVSFLLFWIIENFIIGSVKGFASYFIIFHSFIIALLSVSMVNKLLAQETKNLSRNSIFIICIGFIVYFTYAALVEAFYVYSLTSSTEFQTYVTRILAFVNLFTNLLYALAVLWMPRKKGFSL